MQDDSIKCPFCAETILKDAKKCRYCGEWLIKEEKGYFRRARTVLLWLVSLFLWFIYAYKTLDRSEQAYRHTLNSGPMLSGYSIFLLGLILAFLLKNQIFSKRLNFKSVVANVIVGVVIALGLWTQWSYDPLPALSVNLTGYSQDAKGLRKANEQQNKLAEKGDEASIRQIYREFLSPKDRTMSEDEFIKGSDGSKHINVVINDVVVDGLKGYVDRTLVICANEECSVIEKKSRSFRAYEYENGRWYYRLKEQLCPRTTLHNMEPEFARALSLIQQRALSPTSENLKDGADQFKSVMNCVKIAYAPSENSMEGAEGVFRFSPGQSTEAMTIYVSPRYKSKDDLLTAVLLSHELTHAYNYVNDLYFGDETGCFEDEALAFSIQNAFISALNNEEKQSVTARFTQGGSPELTWIIQAYTQIPRMRGAGYQEKALNFVKSHPGYQQQCG